MVTQYRHRQHRLPNLRIFLRTCKELGWQPSDHLGINKEKLFKAEDIIERRNYINVITTLHTLAKLARKRKYQTQMARLRREEASGLFEDREVCFAYD